MKANTCHGFDFSFLKWAFANEERAHFKQSKLREGRLGLGIGLSLGERKEKNMKHENKDPPFTSTIRQKST